MSGERPDPETAERVIEAIRALEMAGLIEVAKLDPDGEIVFRPTREGLTRIPELLAGGGPGDE